MANDNPFRRIRRKYNLSYKDIKLPNNSIKQLETFKYDVINVKIHHAYIEAIGENNYDPKSVVEEYTEAKHILRKARKLPDLKSVGMGEWANNLNVHPLFFYIRKQNLSILEFCDYIYLREENLSPDKLREFSSLQTVIRQALAQCGMSSDDIEALSQMSRLYHMDN